MRLKVSSASRGNKDRLPEGTYLVEIWRVYTKSQDGSDLIDKSGNPYFSVIFRGISDEVAGKTHWQNFFTEGNFAGRTMQLLKASGVVSMDAAENIDFNPELLTQRVVGIELVQNSKGYINVESVMTEDQFNSLDIPF